jgi:hypothetical protein
MGKSCPETWLENPRRLIADSDWLQDILEFICEDLHPNETSTCPGGIRWRDTRLDEFDSRLLNGRNAHSINRRCIDSSSAYNLHALNTLRGVPVCYFAQAPASSVLMPAVPN